jgi:hypothetical protein
VAIAARRFPGPLGSARRPRAYSPVRQPLLHRFHPAHCAHPDSGAGGWFPVAFRRGHPQRPGFSGVSGAGKTTISRLAPADVTLLTDEVSYIRRGPDGYEACGTPFAGELARVGENCSAPIGCLFFLKQGSENLLEPVAKADAIRRLMRNILFFADDPVLVQCVFQSACEFVEQVPIQQLTFVPDSRAWSMIQ